MSTPLKIGAKLTLDEEALRYAGGKGLERRIYAIMKRRAHQLGEETFADIGNGALNDIEGAWAEYSVASALGYLWDGTVGKITAPDAGPFQVRMSRDLRSGLFLYPRDKPEDWFVLVVGWDGSYTYLGGFRGRDGKVEKWHHPKGFKTECWIVPQRELIEALP